MKSHDRTSTEIFGRQVAPAHKQANFQSGTTPIPQLTTDRISNTALVLLTRIERCLLKPSLKKNYPCYMITLQAI